MYNTAIFEKNYCLTLTSDRLKQKVLVAKKLWYLEQKFKNKPSFIYKNTLFSPKNIKFVKIILFVTPVTYNYIYLITAVKAYSINISIYEK